MKKNLFMTAAAIAALLTGCSTDEEIANIKTSAKNAIGFNIVSNGAETKATIYNNGSTNFDFDVFAFDGSGNYFMGEADELNFGYLLNEDHSAISKHCGVQIYHDGGKWEYKNPSELAYWPAAGSLDFYAVSPTKLDAYQYIGAYTWSIKSNQQTISYRTTNEFQTNIKDLDVMYAVAKGQTKDTKNGAVQLNFKHILSQVLFKAKVQYESMTVTIKEMKIHNLALGGVFTFPSADVEPTLTNWTSTKTHLTTTIKNSNTTNVVANSVNTPVDIIGKNNPMLVIPQTLTAWDTSISKEDADKDENSYQSYLEVGCKIEQNGATAYEGTLYIPFGTEWQPGKRYTYTLIFGGGYDDQGKPILTPITFEPSVENWVDASGYTEQIPAYTN